MVSPTTSFLGGTVPVDPRGPETVLSGGRSTLDDLRLLFGATRGGTLRVTQGCLGSEVSPSIRHLVVFAAAWRLLSWVVG